MSLSTTQINSFAARGFIVLEGFFDPATMDHVSACLDDLRDKDPAPNQEAKCYEQSPINGASILVRIENLLGDHNRKDNAALSFLSSGNYDRKLMTEEWQSLTDLDSPYQPEQDYLLVEADPGDVILFDSYVPHGSPANTSQRPRRNLFLTFNRASDGDLRARYYADKWASYAPNLAPGARAQRSFRV